MRRLGRVLLLVMLAMPVILRADAACAQPAGGAAVSDDAFRAWLGGVRSRASAAGISPATLNTALSGLTIDRRVIDLDRSQPDDSNASAPPSFARYLARRLEGRVEPGRRQAAMLQPALAEIEKRYGVPPPILLAIWGMETSYGGYTGDFDVFRSLATLAYDGRRRKLFEAELLAALAIVDGGKARASEMRGSWAGAMGQPQFLPSSYLAYAVDHDGNGHADIWKSKTDTLASIANYLVKNGWRPGQGWGQPVTVPAELDRARLRELVVAPSCPRVFARHSRWIPVEEWRALGVRPTRGAWPADGTFATLIEPDGPGNGGFLTYGNYRAILKYNCSNFYGLSIGLLADRLS